MVLSLSVIGLQTHFVCSVVGVVVSMCGCAHACQCFCTAATSRCVLLVVLTEDISLSESWMWLFPVCFIWWGGERAHETDMLFLKRTITGFPIEYFLVFPEWAWFCCCFSSTGVKRVPLKSLWSGWQPCSFLCCVGRLMNVLSFDNHRFFNFFFIFYILFILVNVSGSYFLWHRLYLKS